MVTRHLESLVARGNTSDVYEFGRDAVAKVLRPGIPEHWADREAETTQLVHAAGLPSPAVLDVTSIGVRRAIVFERIRGVSMWAQMLEHPEDIGRLCGILAELQAEVNATPAPAGLRSLNDRLHADIGRADLLHTLERAAARTALERLPRGDALCHFDVHPNNVLMSVAGPIVIDWFDAAAGSPEADIVRSSALMRQDASQSHLGCTDPSIIDEVHDQYIAAVRRTRKVDEALLLEWEPLVLAGRLAEPIGDPARKDTACALRALRAAQPTSRTSILGAGRIGSRIAPR